MPQLEDTYILEGMIQGPMPASGESAAKLEAIGSTLGGKNKHFSFQRESGQFSLLADEKVHDLRTLSPLALSSVIQQTLETLMEHFTPPERMRVYSTLRSREFRPGSELQTLYMVVPPGMVRVETRDTPAEVAARPRPMTGKEKVFLGIAAAGMLALGISISAFFVDYGALFGRAITTLKGTKLESLKVETPGLDDYLKVEATGLNTTKDTLTLTLRRGPKWTEGIQTTAPPASADWQTTLALGALRKRYVAVMLFDNDDKPLHSLLVALDPLFTADTCEVAIGFGSNRVVGRVAVRP